MKDVFEQIVAIVLALGTSVGGGLGIWKGLSWLIEKRRVELDERKQLHTEREAHTTQVRADVEMWRKSYLDEVERHHETFEKLTAERLEHAKIVGAYSRAIGHLSEELSEVIEPGET